MNNNKKVLFISYDGMTDPLGQSQVLPYLIELSKQGYTISILSFEKKVRYKAERKIIESIAEKAGITWFPLFFTAKPPILSKMYDRWNMLRKAKQLYRRHKFDLIHCRSYIAAEAGLRLRKKFGTKFLFDMRGFWADEKVDNGQWDLKKFIFRKIYSFYKKKEKQFLLSADGIVSLTEAGKANLLSRPGLENLNIHVIPCCADLQHFDFNRIDRNDALQLKNELKISPGKKVITYLGSVGGWYMTNEMFAFYKKLLLRYPEFVMLILTKDNKEQVLNEALEAGIDTQNIIVRYAKREEVPAYLAISDCSIFFIRPTFSKTASSPTKHAELMGMGIPVICNDIGDTGNIIRESRTGVIVDTFSIGAYNNVIEQLDHVLNLLPADIRQSAFTYFDLQKGAAKYNALYQHILN